LATTGEILEFGLQDFTFLSSSDIFVDEDLARAGPPLVSLDDIDPIFYRHLRNWPYTEI
jgi:hypothetical protein